MQQFDPLRETTLWPFIGGGLAGMGSWFAVYTVIIYIQIQKKKKFKKKTKQKKYNNITVYFRCRKKSVPNQKRAPQ